MTKPKDLRPDPYDSEKIRMAQARERWTSRRAPVQVDVGSLEKGERKASSPHNDDSGHLMRMGDAFGTRSTDFLSVALGQLEQSARTRGAAAATNIEINASIALVHAVAPQDELEAALAVQMAQNHALSTDLMGRAKKTDDFNYLERYTALSVKLQRTFTGQIEALARHRGKGQQTVRVEHVTVQAGAQAVVGDVHHHGGGAGAQPKLEGQPHGTAPTEARAALPSPDAAGNGLPIPRDAERALSHPRRSVTGRAARKPKRAQARRLQPRDDSGEA